MFFFSSDLGGRRAIRPRRRVVLVLSLQLRLDQEARGFGVFTGLRARLDVVTVVIFLLFREARSG